MFNKHDEENYRGVLSGITMKTPVHGTNTLLCEFRLAEGSELPLHKHPHEQTGYCVSGRLELTIDGKTYEATAGDSWCIPGDVEHSAQILENTVAIEVFSPVREDYLSNK